MRVVLKRKLFGGIVVSYDCPNCSERLRSKAAEIGLDDFCPTCSQSFQVPGRDELAEYTRTKARKKAEKEERYREWKKQRKLAAEERQKERQAEKRRREQEQAREQKRRRRESSSREIRLHGDGSFDLEVVGESYRQDNFIRLFGQPKASGVNAFVTACMILEQSNRFDRNAVRIEVEQLHVGYLSRSDAAHFRALIRQSSYPNATRFYCQANVRGGWRSRYNRRDRGMFGIWLDVQIY